MPGAWALHGTPSASLRQAYLGGHQSNKQHWKDVGETSGAHPREPGSLSTGGEPSCRGPAAAPQAWRRPTGRRVSSRAEGTTAARRHGPRAGELHSAFGSPRGIGVHTPSRPHVPCSPGSASPAEPRALSRREFTVSPQAGPCGRGRGEGTLTSLKPGPPRDLKFKCLSQPRTRASVFRYLLSFLPMSELPLRVVPLVKTGHPLRPPPDK